MRKRLSMDVNFTDHHGAIFGGEGGSNSSCGACRQRYRDYGVPVGFNGFCPEEEGMDGFFYFCDTLCADCLLSSPAELAAKIRTGAGEILRKKNTRRKQRVDAKCMIAFADELEKVGSLKDLPGGIMAVKIAEAYREIEGHPKPNRKAA